MKGNLKLTEQIRSEIEEAPKLDNLNMAEIYICEYTTGEYSDRTDMAMCAFSLEVEAANFAKKCNDLLKEKGLYMDEVTAASSDRYEGIDLDGKNYHVDYTGAEVRYYPLELRGV